MTALDLYMVAYVQGYQSGLTDGLAQYMDTDPYSESFQEGTEYFKLLSLNEKLIING